ncbi:MAG: c-type cytochrome [Lewinellaceae bacterium]|nr:c-type cytochrome [Lewinellaceae bacterium]
MKTIFTFLGIALLALWLADCTSAQKSATVKTAPAEDPIAADRAKFIRQLRVKIAGQENTPADSVFQNIQRLNGVTAGRLLNIMDIWGSVLGVSCDHCHATYAWASEIKPEKEIARQMMDLTIQLNENLKKIEALEGTQPSVSCYTCHRGSTRPETKPK